MHFIVKVAKLKKVVNSDNLYFDSINVYPRISQNILGM